MSARIQTARSPSPRAVAGWLAVRGALLVVVIVFGLPILWAIASALDEGSARAVPWPRDFTVDHFRALFDDFDAGVGLRNSLIISISSMALAVTISALAGYGLSRLRSRRKMWFLYGLLLLQTIPFAVTMVPIYDLAVRLRLQDSFLGLILTHAAIALPFLIWVMKGFIDAVPQTVEEAARLDGASPLRAWFDVVLPLTLPGLAVVAGFAFVAAWSEVLMAILLINDPDRATLPFIFYRVASGGSDAHQTAALGVLYVLPVVALFMALRKLMVRGLVNSAHDL